MLFVKQKGSWGMGRVKMLCTRKMRENLYNDDDPDLTTKKLWSHVKSKNACHRIPECMHRNNIYRNKSTDKAELFHEFFINSFLILLCIILILTGQMMQP